MFRSISLATAVLTAAACGLLQIRPANGQLIGYWPLDDNAASNTVVDLSGNNYNGSLVTPSGTAMNTSGFSVPGKIGSAININGQVRIDLSAYAGATGALSGLSSFSLSVWFQNYDGGTNQEYWIWQGGGQLQLEMYGNHLSGYDSGIGTMDSGVTATQLTSPTWQLFVVTFTDTSTSPSSSNRNSTVNEYAVNGTGIFATNNRPGYRSPVDIQSTLPNFYLGSGQAGNSTSLAGAIDDAAIWSSVLTSDETLALYNFADNPTLNYGAGTVSSLFSVFNSTLPSYTVNGLTWTPTTGLNQTPGSVVQTGTVFTVQLDDQGDGLTTTAATGGAWTGGAGTTNWATAGNWSGKVPGATSGTTNTDTATFNQAVTFSPLTIDSGRNLQSLTFDTGNVSSITVGTTTGNALLLTNGGFVVSTASVTNPQIINAPLVLEGTAGTYTFSNLSTTNAATLTFGGAITPGASSGVTTLTLNGSNTGANTISGSLSDHGGAQLAVTKAQAGTWTLSGTDNYTGATTVSGGTLRIGGSLSASPISVMGGSLVVASGGSLGTNTMAVSSGSASVASGCTVGAATVNLTGGSQTIASGATQSVTPRSPPSAPAQSTCNRAPALCRSAPTRRAPPARRCRSPPARRSAWSTAASARSICGSKRASAPRTRP